MKKVELAVSIVSIFTALAMLLLMLYLGVINPW